MQALVIDDSKAMRAILGRILRDLGYEVREAEHGQIGLERLREPIPTDLVLVDWNMPVLDGLGFLRGVREAGDLGGFRTIVVTAETGISQMTQALAAGADDYVLKPFTREMIFQKLESLGMGASTR
jgi:two-component system chemotaxis response regulator CheY